MDPGSLCFPEHTLHLGLRPLHRTTSDPSEAVTKSWARPTRKAQAFEFRLRQRPRDPHEMDKPCGLEQLTDRLTLDPGGGSAKQDR